ncbi:sugar-binding transcriptional regulator [Tessaracoccus palaemonis]|uniref:MarR family transcriptional regulator n=1 Tax=Tessaracoccus palaemonis TaxID=2829499 RepID=A0ABX8SN46_9ACTN|nr:sugar-binding domain-containing protein [Tessaracoccus palaemonis]QXT62609.1 MarR family transcriptional regulator [Tessaracoccus palaemonis]
MSDGYTPVVGLDTAELMVKVARLYHERGMKQQAIAEQLHLSQSRVSRLLKQAAAQGIVRVSVVPPAGLEPDLEDEVRDRYGLRDVVVVRTGSLNSEEMLPALGGVAGRYIEATLTGEDVVGLSSWSRTLLRAVDAMSIGRTRLATAVVQLIGGVGRAKAQLDATRLASRLCEVTGAEPYLLNVPGLVSTAAARDALLADPNFVRTAERWRDVTVALVGVGSLSPSPLLRDSGNSVSEDEVESLRALGAVGDVVLKFVDSEGRRVGADLDQRTVSIDQETYLRIPRRLGVAGGEEKFEAIRAMLRGGWLNVLITDDTTARRLVATSD